MKVSRIALFILLGLSMPAVAEPIYEVVSSRIVVENPGGMPALCWAANGDLLLAYATNWQPIPPAGGTVNLMRSRDGGKTWSQPEIIVHPKDPEKWSIHMWSGLHRVADGSMILAYGDNCSEDVAEAYVIRSTDHGQTWGDPVRLASEPVWWGGQQKVIPYTEGFGHPVTAPNGDVLLPIEARGTGGGWGDKASAFVRSTDNGQTWGPLEFIANGLEKFGETSMGVAANGDIVAIIRCDTTRRVLWQSVSHDNGNSWTSPVRTVAVNDTHSYVHGKMPDVLSLSSGRLLMAVGSVGVNDGSEIGASPPGSSFSGIYVSDDYGATWRPDVLFEAPDPVNLIPYDSPVLVKGPGANVLALSVQADRRLTSNPKFGWTMGSHYVLHVIREAK